MASSVTSASSTSILESLPARPPTPPREALHETDITLKSSVCRTLTFDPTLSLQTPPNANSPRFPVATDSDPSCCSRVRKKVEWSTHTDYREAPQFHNTSKPIRSSPFSAPSSASSKPVKGILKPTPSSNQSASSLGNETDGSQSPLNIIEMLDSSIKQLAGHNRDAKLDAYMMLSRTLKASNNLPDRVALQNKMSLLMHFIQRDMTAKSTAGVLDSSLINHSLTLLATFLHFPAIASTLTTDFGVFVLEHSIRSFEDEATPKDVVRHLMQVVAFQNFSSKVVTLDRVGRLVAAVHNIDTYIKGKSIVMSRLHIYKRLVKQSRTHMAIHCDWLKDMFTDMLSTVKDIRSQAISLGAEAGFTLRSEKQLSRKVTEIFQTTTDTETYIDFFIKKLQNMVQERQTCAAVPQIWSVVILFLRYPLDRWHYYGPWLTLVQSAFNMTDRLTKQEANFAWNRYVYLTLSDCKVNPKTISTLCQPLLSQLRRKPHPKQREEAMKLRRIVIGGICNLYYYTFAPGSDKYMPDVIWDVAVKPVINQLSSLDDKSEVLGSGVMQAAGLLVSLLDVSTPRIWRQDRIMDSTPVKPDELPAIDSKWIRKNCDKVIDCVGPILCQRFCDLAQKDSLVCRLWQALVTSVAVASAKDIKVSEETAKFVGCAFGILSKVVTAATAGAEAGTALLDVKFLPSLSNYIQLLIGGLGILPFTEKRLSMAVPNTFKPVSTPSHRPDRTDTPCGDVRMPLQHLFVMLSAIPTDHADHDSSNSFFQLVFRPFLKNKTTKSRLDLSKELLHLIPCNTLSPAGPWLFTAGCAKAFLEGQSSNDVNFSPEQILGPDYKEIVCLLERGLTSHQNVTATAWLSLLQAVATRVTNDFGDAGCCLAVVEPLAKSLYDLVTSFKYRPGPLTLEAVIALFNLAKFPSDKQALEAARSKLWGTSKSVIKATPIQPMEALYHLGNHFLSYLYQHNDGLCLNTSIFIETISSFLDKNWTASGLSAVINLQSGLDKWIQDDEAILASGCHSSLPSIVTNVWGRICSKLVLHCEVKAVDMSQIEPLLISGFKSKYPSIVHCTATTWNAIVKNDEDVACSDVLKSVMSSASSRVVLFPRGSSRDRDVFGTQEPFLVQQEIEVDVVDSRLLTREENASSAIDTPVTGSSRRSLRRKRRMETTPGTARDQPTNRTSTSRLRHDDSQIQFEPVTSPLPPEEESQHLTERQMEVRERQQSNTALYSGARPTSPPASHIPSRCNRIDDASESGKQIQNITPKQNKSFEDLISSTPTPRRGDFLQMDDFNDPPSSPPIPRPYPLLSEIQSRSRTRPMENWKFSSPPASPAENQHRHTESADLRSSAPTETFPVESLRSSKTQQRVKNRAREHVVEAATDERAEQGRVVTPEAEFQEAKLLKSVTTRARKSQDTPISEDIASSKVKSTSMRRSSRQLKLGRKNEGHVASYLGSSLDAATMLRLNSATSGVEAALSGQSITEPLLANAVADSTVKPIEPHECIMVHTNSTCPSPKQLKGTTIEDMEPIVPPTPAETAENSILSEPHRKRKRESKCGAIVKKKKCSSVHELTESQALKMEPTSIPVSLLEIAPVPAMGVETRSGLRKRQHQGGSHGKEPARSNSGRHSTTLPKTRDDGDTDEEVQSQLVTESHAASQQSQSQQSSGKATHESSVTEHIETTSDVDVVSRRNKSFADGNETQKRGPVMGNAEKTESVIGSLRNGLEQLRGISLTREKVYEVEDILMDMKRELFEAERRGRVQPRPAKPRKRSSRRR
ncbi:hypothetical protein E4U43_006064 [Claviceps pusilla]|uniref:Telomere-associated protein Rif1 N-terminal domain-containing protein n=1 Tax=Claviceps pusilla TaxID=123648 RepID=A0A9P7T2Q7_9HYPO|nr:hypothetical protein E4U43_006064 [Claviceps pusilla]